MSQFQKPESTSILWGRFCTWRQVQAMCPYSTWQVFDPNIFMSAWSCSSSKYMTFCSKIFEQLVLSRWIQHVISHKSTQDRGQCTSSPNTLHFWIICNPDFFKKLKATFNHSTVTSFLHSQKSKSYKNVRIKPKRSLRPRCLLFQFREPQKRVLDNAELIKHYV